MKFIKVLILIIITVSLFYCKREEIVLHGEITGMVTKGLDNPLVGASVTLTKSNDTIDTFITGSDGIYLIKGLVPGDYVIQATKEDYAEKKVSVTIASAETDTVDFRLNLKLALEIYPDNLDFGPDTIQRTFTIQKNIALEGIYYGLWTSDTLIQVNPRGGSLYLGTDTITVTIDTTGFSENSFSKEFIIIDAVTWDDVPLVSIISVYWNRSK